MVVFFFFFVAVTGFIVGLRRIACHGVSCGGTDLQFPEVKVAAQLSASGTCSVFYL